MSHETWDQEAFEASIPVAREKVEFAAQFIEVGPSQPRWESHRPVIELVFYLCKLDYDIKVLLFQFFTNSENRTVWERYRAGGYPDWYDRSQCSASRAHTDRSPGLSSSDDSSGASGHAIRRCPRSYVLRR